MSTLLPSSVALLSNNNNKYLRYVSETNADRFRFLQFSGEEILSPNVKFEIERATGGLVHIRSSFSNKYLRRENANSFWIMAVADEAEEDRSKWECTLFEPIQVQAADGNNNLVIRLRHVQLNHYLRLFSPNERFQQFLYAEKSTISTSNSELFTVTNWDTLVELPRFIALKGDNGKYLIPYRSLGTGISMHFGGTSIGDVRARLEVIPNSDGSVVLKCNNHGLELTLAMHEWTYNVIAFSDSMIDLGLRAWFQPHYVDEGVLALRTYPRPGYHTRFINREHRSGLDDILVAEHESVMDVSKLVVEEPILRRVVTITYRLEDARIYDLTPILLFNASEDNHQSLTTITKDVTLNYETSTTTTWTSSVSLKLGFKYTLHVDIVPIIARQSFEFSSEFAGSYEFGETSTTKLSFTDSGTYTIKPRHKLIVRKVATQGRCDIPYSYTVTDFMMNGDVIGPIKKEDGVFNGVNCFDIHTTTHQEPFDV